MPQTKHIVKSLPIEHERSHTLSCMDIAIEYIQNTAHKLCPRYRLYPADVTMMDSHELFCALARLSFLPWCTSIDNDNIDMIKKELQLRYPWLV